MQVTDRTLSRTEVAALSVAIGAIFVPLLADQALLPFLGPPRRPATREFDAAAAGVIPALLIPFAIGLRSFVGLLHRWTPVDIVALGVLAFNLLYMILGEAAALRGLNCEAQRCGSGEDLREVYIGLISATGLLVSMVVLTLMESFREARDRASRHH